MAVTKDNPATVNVFGTPGDKHIKVYPRRTAVTRDIALKNKAAKGAVTSPGNAPNTGGRLVGMSDKTAEQRVSPGGSGYLGSAELLFDPTQPRKEAAMDKEANYLGMLGRGVETAARFQKTYSAIRKAQALGRVGSTLGRSGRVVQAVGNAAKSGARTWKATGAAMPKPPTPAWATSLSDKAYNAGKYVGNSRLGPAANKVTDWAGRAGSNVSLLGGLQGAWTGSGVDAINRFATGNESYAGTIAGGVLGAFNPALGRAFSNVGRVSPGWAKATTNAANAWKGTPMSSLTNASGATVLPRLIGGRGMLRGAATTGQLGDMQQRLTNNQRSGIPGGFNYANPIGTANRSRQISMQHLADQFGFKTPEQMTAFLNQLRQIFRALSP